MKSRHFFFFFLPPMSSNSCSLFLSFRNRNSIVSGGYGISTYRDFISQLPLQVGVVIRVKFRPVGPERGSFLQLLCRALKQKLLVSDNNCYTLFWRSGREPFTSPWPRPSACVHTVISLISLFGKNLLYLLGSLCCLLSPRSYLPAQLWAVVSILTTLPGPHKCSLNKWVDQWIPCTTSEFPCRSQSTYKVMQGSQDPSRLFLLVTRKSR